MMVTRFMMTRFLVPLLLIAVVVMPSAQAEKTETVCEALFVQNAKGFVFEGQTLTMKEVNPIVTFFCDRPVRHAGHLTTEQFLESWRKGKDTFTDDPPNAVLSVLGGDQVIDVVVELTDNPRVNGDELSYDVRILEGEAPQKGGPVSLFIDIIGMPLTPISYGGAARRGVRRCAYGVTCW